MPTSPLAVSPAVPALAAGQPMPLADVPAWVQALPARVAAGFPSPAEDHAVQRLDLMAELIRHPQATFLLRVRGDSMREAGIFDGDVVLVDRAVRARSGHVVIAVVDGEFVCKTLLMRAGRVRLKAANPTYADIEPRDGQSLEVWGVVVAAIKQFRV
jgi:DNA polymerase V